MKKSQEEEEIRVRKEKKKEKKRLKKEEAVSFLIYTVKGRVNCEISTLPFNNLTGYYIRSSIMYQKNSTYRNFRDQNNEKKISPPLFIQENKTRLFAWRKI